MDDTGSEDRDESEGSDDLLSLESFQNTNLVHRRHLGTSANPS